MYNKTEMTISWHKQVPIFDLFYFYNTNISANMLPKEMQSMMTEKLVPLITQHLKVFIRDFNWRMGNIWCAGNYHDSHTYRKAGQVLLKKSSFSKKLDYYMPGLDKGGGGIYVGIIPPPPPPPIINGHWIGEYFEASGQCMPLYIYIYIILKKIVKILKCLH